MPQRVGTNPAEPVVAADRNEAGDGVALSSHPTTADLALDAAELAAVVFDEYTSPEHGAHPAATADGLRAMLDEGAHDGERVHAAELVAAALAWLPPQRRSLVARVHDGSQAWLARGRPDPARLVARLLTSLAQAGGEARVEVRTHDAPGFACITLRTPGTRISHDVLASANEPVLASGPRRGGRELAVVRSIASALGGSLTLANEPAPDGETVAVLSLPALPDARTIAPASSGVLAGRVILLVDDDAPLARALGRVLAGAGADARISTSAVDALRRLEAQRPDALVTDFQLADGDGLGLVRRASQQTPAVRAVLVTALLDPSLVALATQMGASAVIQKPFDPARLVAVLAELFGPDG